MYYVLGIELNYAEVWGAHSHKKTAQEQAEYLKKQKILYVVKGMKL